MRGDLAVTRKLHLGQPVRFQDTIRRVFDFEGARGTTDRRHVKKWIRHADWYPQAGPQTGTGILVGLRTLQDGEQPYPRPEDGWSTFGGFRATKHHKIAVIATHLRRKPIMAFLEDVTVIHPGHTDSARVQDGSATKETA